MKKYLKIVVSLCIIALFTGNAFSQGLNAIINTDDLNIMAVGDNGKVLRSSNGGTTWSRNTVGTANFKCIDNSGIFVWAGGSDGKVYKSAKTSSALEATNTGSTNSINGISFSVSTGFVCMDGGLVYKSTNEGASWVLKNTGIPNVKLNAIEALGPTIAVVVGDNGAAYKTTNGGDSWTVITTGTTRNLLAIMSKQNIFYVTGGWGTYFSYDYQSGIVTPSTLKNRTDVTAISGTSMLDIHIGGGGGFIRNNRASVNDATFSTFETNPMLANLTGLSFNSVPTGIGFACSNETDAIIKTTNYGTSWALTAGATVSISWVSKLSASGGIGNNLCENPHNRDVLYVVYNTTIYRSGNKGDNWVNIGTVGASSGSVNSAHSFYVSPLDTNIMMCAIQGSPDKVVRSTNYGATWTTILSMNFSNYGMPLEMDQNDPSKWYYAPDGGGFWVSTNNGANFTEVSNNYPFRSPCDVIVKWGDSREIMIADGITSASQPADIFKSTNGGANWYKVHTNTGSGASEIPAMTNTAFEPGTAYATNWSGNMRYKTINGGDNWTAIASTPWSGWNADVSREDPTVVLTGNYGAAVSLSTNAGANWTAYTLPSGGCGAGLIVPARNYQIAMQCSGLLKMVVNYTVITNVEEQVLTTVPTKFDLYQNYPNPFNPSTEIKYDILNAGNVSMNVYDISGKQVYTLVSGHKQAGSYSVKFDASSLSSGVYYYTLESAGNTFTKKMLLVK